MCPSGAKRLPCSTHWPTPRGRANWMRMEMTNHQRLILQSPLAISLFVTKEKARAWLLALGTTVIWGYPTAASYWEAHSSVHWIQCEYHHRFLYTLRLGAKYSAHFKLHSYLNALETKYSACILIPTAAYVPEVIQKGVGLGRGDCQLIKASQSQVDNQISFKLWEGITPRKRGDVVLFPTRMGFLQS